MIATHRKSQALTQWLDTGELGDVELNIEHAYQLLELPGRTISDDLIIPSFLVLVSDNPSKKHNYEKALRAIAEERNSDILRAHLTDMDPSQGHRPTDWPVGLINIGNTCYLNSLLQYFFSIKPVREVVLDFENHKDDVNSDSILEKKAGGRKIDRPEAVRSQLFTNELRRLFESMATSPNKTVKPEKELARLTILNSKTEASVKTRRESLSLKNPTSQAEAMGQTGNGPVTEKANPVQSNTAGNTLETIPDVDTMDEDRSSGATLVPEDDIANNEMAKQVEALDNKEDLSPMDVDILRPQSPDEKPQPSATASSSRANEQSIGESINVEKFDENSVPDGAPKRRPPPVPTNSNKSESDGVTYKDVQIEATQRDVAEVIDNVTHQLKCAIKADITTDDGQMTDIITQLFSGKSQDTYDNDQVETKITEFQDIKIRLPDGPLHIYEALDAEFGEHNVRLGASVETRHGTILSLPPILQIFVSRGHYDKDRNVATKLEHHLKLDKTIYMDRYLETDDPDLLTKRSNSWRWKRELRDLNARKQYLSRTDIGLSMAESLEAATGYLLVESSSENEEVPTKQKNVATKIGDAAVRTRYEEQGIFISQHPLFMTDITSDLEKRITQLQTQIDSQFVDLKNHAYSLFAVFIHLGGMTSGHYWIYIHDFRLNIWRKYNDTYVTEVSEEEVFSAGDSNRPSTSTFVVYVKAGMEEELTEPIYREIKDEAGETSADNGPQNLPQQSENGDGMGY